MNLLQPIPQISIQLLPIYSTNLLVVQILRGLVRIDTMKRFYCLPKGASVVPWGRLSFADYSFTREKLQLSLLVC